MRIAIQGHPFRGKEVIQILKSLGGKSIFAGLGFNERYYYYINFNDMIRESLITIKTKEEFKLYTLEEFEKEFPFKVGDVVVTLDNKSYKIVTLEYYNNKMCYKLDNGFYYRPQMLKLYKEMKKERNITLTLDKAKEWYNKGGELKEIALQAFSEKELNPLPTSWEAYCIKYGYVCLSTRYTNIPLKYDALLKLEQLRDCWRQGNIPQKKFKYKIRKVIDKYEVVYGIEDSFLSFCNLQTAEEFLKCFRDLIEKAGDLI